MGGLASDDFRVGGLVSDEILAGGGSLSNKSFMSFSWSCEALSLTADDPVCFISTNRAVMPSCSAIACSID